MRIESDGDAPRSWCPWRSSHDLPDNIEHAADDRGLRRFHPNPLNEMGLLAPIVKNMVNQLQQTVSYASTGSFLFASSMVQPCSRKRPKFSDIQLSFDQSW